MIEEAAIPVRILPEGTVTFLFTDIEGSTKLLRQLGDEYADVLADQRGIFRGIFTKWHGREVDTQGDSFFVSFPRATEAVTAAVEIQRALAEHNWPQDVQVRVRMGLHTGEPLAAEEGYVGMDVHRAARIAHVGHGGQVLLSATTTELVIDELPDGVSLLDLGRHRLKDIARPEHIRQLVISGLPNEFPVMKSVEALGPEVVAEEPIRLPAFLEEDAAEEPETVFVGREIELETLSSQLQKAISGQGGVAFVAGDAGSGKSALLQAFADLSLNHYPELLVVQGMCNAFSGSGDPYLPFRNALRMLAGDVEALWEGGTITRTQALNLWSAIPVTTRALIDEGKVLIDNFVPGESLMARLSAASPGDYSLVQRLQQVIESEIPQPGELEQAAVFSQYCQVFRQVSKEYPILLLLDDLQWADSGSINLLFHLCRQLYGARLFVVGAYRPEEISLGRKGEQHPLSPVLDELKREHGDVWVDLNNVQGELFVDAFLDTEPNQLGGHFRRMLLSHTGGQALFTVELLRDLQERGDLFQDEVGQWMESSALAWDKLPARVEGVIAARIGRLEEELRDILTVASVEGEDFTAQVIARVQEIQERQLLRTLSVRLAKRHQLVRERSALRIGKRHLARYRFSHALFQRYLYNDISDVERGILHGEIAAILEELYADRLGEIMVQLAVHYAEAGIADKAVKYLLRAGDKSREQYAYREAIDHYRRALTFLEEPRDSELAARTMMKLGLTYHHAFDIEKASLAYEEGFNLWRQAISYTPIAPVTPAPHALRMLQHFPVILDPAYTIAQRDLSIIGNLLSGIAQYAGEKNVIPDVAQDWKIMEEGARYVIHLKDDVMWSDGVPVTAADFEFAWKRILNPETKAMAIARLLYDIKGASDYHQGFQASSDEVGVKAIDDTTLDVLLEGPTAYFPHLLANENLRPLPSHIVKKLGKAWCEPGNLVTNGPFLLESGSAAGPMTLVRNPSYHGRFAGNLERIDLYQRDQERHPLSKYREDEVDIMESGEIPREHFEAARLTFAEEYITGPAPMSVHLILNSTKPPLDDVRVRRALASTIDRERLLSVVPGAFAKPAAGGLIPPSMPGHSPGIGLPYDIEGARQLLAEAGYPGGRGFPSISITTYKQQAPLMELLAAEWHDLLGIDVLCETVDWHTYIRSWFHTHVFPSSWEADYPDPDAFMRVCVSNKPWSNSTYDKLVRKARRIMDHDERMKLYRQADRILVEEAAIVPLSYPQMHAFAKPWVRNSWEALYDYRWKDVVIEPH